MNEDINVAEDRRVPGDWRVEVIDGDGGVAVTLFSGPDAKGRAEQYAASLRGER